MKHGKEYVRFIVDFEKKLKGVSNCAASGFAELELDRDSRRGKCMGQIL
jgi:hypothetical protein